MKIATCFHNYSFPHRNIFVTFTDAKIKIRAKNVLENCYCRGKRECVYLIHSICSEVFQNVSLTYFCRYSFQRLAAANVSRNQKRQRKMFPYSRRRPIKNGTNERSSERLSWNIWKALNRLSSVVVFSPRNLRDGDRMTLLILAQWSAGASGIRIQLLSKYKVKAQNKIYIF